MFCDHMAKHAQCLESSIYCKGLLMLKRVPLLLTCSGEKVTFMGSFFTVRYFLMFTTYS